MSQVFDVTPADQRPACLAPAFDLDGTSKVSSDAVAHYRKHGVVCLRSVLEGDTVERLREAVDCSAAEPGPLGYKIGEPGKPGFFYYDFQMHQRLEGFDWLVHQSNASRMAGDLMGSPGVTLYYSNLFVKDGGSKVASPWHEDAAYQRIDGEQCLNFWIALDPIPDATTLIFLSGSHRRGGPVFAPRHFDPDAGYEHPLTWNRAPMPAPEELEKRFSPIWWTLEPGDALVFNHRTIHGAPANTMKTRRRAAALLLIGDEARYNADPGTSDPPFCDDSKAHGDHPAGQMFPRLI